MAIERVSEAQDGTEANGASNTGDNRGISATGQFVVFSSAANNLGPADGDSDSDIYRVDTTTGDVVLVTAGSAAVPLTGPNRQPVVSADGNIVAFINGSGTTFNGLPQGDLYVVNVATGDIELIQSNAANPSLSADGTKLVFESTDDANGSGTDVNGGADVFLVTLSGVAAASIVRVSDAASGGVSGNGASYLPVISADGNFIAFESLASDLVGGDLNGTRDVFRYNVATGAIELASAAASPTAGASAAGQSANPSISGDGSVVTFTSDAADLGPSDTNFTFDIYANDFGAGTVTRVSEGTGGVEATAPSFRSSISDDGRFVAFQSSAALDAADTNGGPDIYVHDRTTGETALVSAGGDLGSGQPMISPDGSRIAFESDATTLTTDGNSVSDVFIADNPLFGAPPAGSVFSVAANAASVAEGNGGVIAPNFISFTVTRTGDLSQAASVDLIVNSTEADASDFLVGSLPITATIAFEPDQATAVRQFPISGDIDFEPDEEVVASLANPSTGSTVDALAGSASVVIVNDDVAPTPELTVAITEAEISENGGLSTATVTRSGDTTGDLVVTLISSDTSEATVPATVTILDGEASATFDVTGADDTDVDGPQTVTVTASAAGFTDGTDSVDVTDDDVPPTPELFLTLANDTILENGGTTFGLLERTGDTTGDLVVTLTSSDTTEATVPPTVTIPDGAASVQITVTGQDDPDIDGSQPVTITASATGYTDGSDFLEVLDDDLPNPPVFSISASPATGDAVAEGAPGAGGIVTIVVERTGDTSRIDTVDYRIETGTAGSDDFTTFVPTLDPLIFGVGETIKTFDVQFSGDTDFEPDETFIVSLQNPSAGTSIDLAAASVTGTILNDDAPVGPVDLIVNGGFEDHPDLPNGPAPGWGTFDDIPGWQAIIGQVEVQELSGPSGNVEGDAVVELDADGNSLIQQTVTVPTAGIYRLAFDYAMGGADPLTNGVTVLVDGEPVAMLFPDAPGYQTFALDLDLPAGDITLGFEGTGTSDARGTHINNVSMIAVTPNGDNAYPVAVDDTAETDVDTAINIDALFNDSDPDVDELLLIDVDQPASGNGTVVLERDGTVTYTPNAGFTGQDTFTYTVADGRGGSDTGTVTVRVGPQGPVFGEELIVNGEFEEHPDLPNGPAPGWGIFSAITGWTALVGGVEVQELSGPSGNAEGDAVVELDADGNSVIQQIVDVPADGFYRFAFEYAAAGDAATNGISVSVGGQTIDVPPPTPGYDTFEIVLELTAGANAVVFEGLGTSDARGTHIDSVSLQRVPPPEPPAGNLFVNGDFEDHPDLPNGPAPGWGVFTEIPGWVATVGGIEVQELSGPSGNVEGDAVVELDADFNSRIEQTVTVDADGLFAFSFDYALGGDDPTTNGMDVFVNDVLLVSLSPVAPGYVEFSTVLDLAAGDYTFAFAATGTSDARGTHINNVSLSAADDILST